MKTRQESFFDEEIQKQVENCLQVTIGNRSLIFNLDETSPEPISEEGAQD